MDVSDGTEYETQSPSKDNDIEITPISTSRTTHGELQGPGTANDPESLTWYNIYNKQPPFRIHKQPDVDKTGKDAGPRWAKYKSAVTQQQFLKGGTKGDLQNDLRNGYFRFTDPVIQKKWMDTGPGVDKACKRRWSDIVDKELKQLQSREDTLSENLQGNQPPLENLQENSPVGNPPVAVTPPPAALIKTG